MGINEFNTNKPKIGTESLFEITKGNPLGLFNIMITAWNLKDWSFYEEMLLKEYPNCELEKIDNRAFLHIDKILNGEEEQILNRSKNHYDYLINLTSGLRQIATSGLNLPWLIQSIFLNTISQSLGRLSLSGFCT